MKTASVSTKRKILFSIVMLFIPLLFLASTELLLRVINYGDSYPLVHKKKVFGKEKYVLNRKIGNRYFTLPETRIPEASEEIFDVVKKPNTLRIFCLGGSTTAGFPYEINPTFPFQLRFRLKEVLTENEVEVINLGLSAVNSYTVLDLLPEVLELEPDVLIIYMGHNEFYGAHGVGSTQYVSSNRALVFAYLKLRRLRLTRLMQNIIAGIKGIFGSSGQKSPRSMMQAMAKDQEIPLNSEKFHTACQNFEANLAEIIRIARKQNVQVLVSSLVSNLKDQPPFVSKFSSDLDAFSRQRCETLLLEGRGHLESGENKKAQEIFAQIAALDTSAADLQYYRGQACLAAGDTLTASRHFSKARDLDQLRFRAPGAFNKIIHQVAKQENIPLVDVERIFSAASHAGIPGMDLLLEHLHPNFEGYRLMAQAFLEALRVLQVINPPEPIVWKEELLSPEHVRYIIKEFPKDSAGVTELDLEFGNYRNFFLVHRWPFPERPITLSDYVPVGSEMTKTLAVKHYRENTFWDDAHYQLANHYNTQKQYKNAFREYRAVLIAFPENYYPAVKMADMLVMMKKYRRAKKWYEWALDLKPGNPHILAKIGNLFVFIPNFSEAVHYLTESLKSDSKCFIFAVGELCQFERVGQCHRNYR
jgi:tetratricopeptide (TPR) repeat protein